MSDHVEESSTPGAWLEISVEVDSESVEPVSDLFSRYGYSAGVAIFEPFLQDPDGSNLQTDSARLVRVVTYLPVDGEEHAALERIREGFWHLSQIRPMGALHVEQRPEEDWANAWKDHFHVLRIGDRIVIRPSWRDHDPSPNDIVIDLDPGMAFGTGHHPTTELCLRWLEELPVEGSTILDAGAGSGILSIAMAKLGAASVDAVEIDSVAARALRENVLRNGVQDVVHAIDGSVAAIDPNRRYDLVVANIISSILLDLRLPLVHAVESSGSVLLSGVIDRHLTDVREAFTASGLSLLETRQIGDWFALLFEAHR